MKHITLSLAFFAVFAVGSAQNLAKYDSLMTKARAYSKQKEYQKSNACYEQIIDFLETLDNQDILPSIKALVSINYIHLGIDALRAEDFNTSKKHFDKALEYADTDPKATSYIQAWKWQGNWYRNKAVKMRRDHQDPAEGLDLLLQAEMCFKKINESKKILDCQLTRAELLIDLAKDNDAKKLLLQTISECGNDTTLSNIKGQALFHLGKLEVEQEQFQQAIQHMEQSFNILQKSNPDYAHLAANNLYSLYTYNIPDAKKAAFWSEKSNYFMERYIADDEVRAYKSVTQNFLDRNYPEARDTIVELINRCEAKTNFPPSKLSEYYKTLALIQQQGLKQYSLSEQNYKHALTLAIEAGEVGKKDLPEIWYELTLLYGNWNKPDEAMAAAENCIQTTTNHFGPLHSETMRAYSMRSNFAGFYNLRDTALNDRQKCFEIIKKNIERNFAYLTATERSAYWNKFLDETTIMFTFAHKLEEYQSDYTDDLFNQQLMAKGLLLNAESSLQRAIESNPELKNTYQKIKELRKESEASEVNPLEAEAAMREADRLERTLGSNANSIHQFLDFLKVKAEDVKKHLKFNEIAIEFANYRVGKDSVIYAALILSPQWSHVRFLPLIEERELTYNQGNISEKIWKPLMAAVPKEVNTIYFAPTGQLYQLPIESQKLIDGRFISDVYRLYRLSSTRWLAISGDQTQGKDAIVYGGLQYNATVKDMLADAQQYPRQRSAEPTVDALRWGLEGLKYLPGTKVEANNIVETINQADKQNFHAKAFLGADGTEASFKALDGQQTRTIHIATHGFYQKGKSEDNDLNSALTRNGLFFAGADNKRQGEPLPEGLDDGILTAEEISMLDLRELDLVVLSACQTGQGEVSADGVFGLQRGFKKAGANSIIMSLWKVDDNATRLLMTEFYKHWMAGMSKHDALEKAKQTVRTNTEKDWSDPKYWAAFILLDGVE